MMKPKLFLTGSLSVIGFFILFPLMAMGKDEDNRLNGNEASTINFRLQRDLYLERGDDLNAAHFALRVINLDPEAPDNEYATIEDFRAARDIFGRLAINDPERFLSDATSYGEGAASYEEATSNDFIIIRNLYLKQGEYKFAAYYNDLLPENSFGK